ncbi:helix-turn-helix domain-containing protein [Tabrizicola sp. M-4]|uniref:helix-turn-helix domain-containing protein n=1 Tax=Tabrizicola sp. M-4 TaxID=3055847 RepID=UPI003DA7B4A7
MKSEPIILTSDPLDEADFDVSGRAMERALRARLVRRTRLALGLSQAAFAQRFHVPVGTLRDWEQARATPPDFAMAYMRVIARHPELVIEATA